DYTVSLRITSVAGDSSASIIVKVLPAFSNFDILDPNPDLLDDRGAVTSDLLRIAGAGHIVKGVAADGVTEVVLRVFTAAEDVVRFSVEPASDGCAPGGLLSQANTIVSTVSTHTNLVGSRSMATAIYVAP